MSAQNWPFAFQAEFDLEDILEADLSPTGLELLTIGRQVTTDGGVIDLLAIDLTGVIYIIELKVDLGDTEIITQVLGYRRSMKQLNREKVIRLVADGRLKVDLVESFQRHFGHPLPETVNESQVLMIIAVSIHHKTAIGILELLDEGRSVTTFRYVVQGDAVSLIPCCRNDQDVKEGLHLRKEPVTPASGIVAYSNRPRISRTYVNKRTRRFWLAHAHDFMPFVTFQFIYNRFKDWVRVEEGEGMPSPMKDNSAGSCPPSSPSPTSGPVSSSHSVAIWLPMRRSSPRSLSGRTTPSNTLWHTNGTR